MTFEVGDIVHSNGWTGRITQIYKDCCKFDGFELLLLKMRLTQANLLVS